MDAINAEAERYLNELFLRTAGNADTQVSMFDVGAALGLEKDAAGRLAEDLIAEGLVEIKTLSGGIGITAQGVETVRAAGGVESPATLNLGSGPVIEEKGRQDLEHVLTGIKNSLASGSASYARLEEMVIDLKTIDIQLLSPRPKTDVIKQVLRSLKDGLDASGASAIAAEIEKLIGD